MKTQHSTPRIKPRTVLPCKPRKRRSKKAIQTPPSLNLLKCFGYSLEKPFSSNNENVKLEIVEEKDDDKEEEPKKSDDDTFTLHVRPDLETTAIDPEVKDTEFIDSESSDEENLTENSDKTTDNINVINIESLYSKQVKETNSTTTPTLTEEESSTLPPKLTTDKDETHFVSDDEIEITKIVPGKNFTSKNSSVEVKMEIKEELDLTNVDTGSTVKDESESKHQLQELLRSSQSHKINRMENKLDLILSHFSGQNNLSNLSKLIDSTSPSTTIMPETITLTDDLDDEILGSPTSSVSRQSSSLSRCAPSSSASRRTTTSRPELDASETPPRKKVKIQTAKDSFYSPSCHDISESEEEEVSTKVQEPPLKSPVKVPDKTTLEFSVVDDSPYTSSSQTNSRMIQLQNYKDDPRISRSSGPKSNENLFSNQNHGVPD